MMRILIAVASKHGSTREIAQAIAEEMRAAELTVDLREAGAVPDIAGYDAVILGSAIYMGSWRPEAKQFAGRHQQTLARLPVWLFSSGPLGTTSGLTQDDPRQLAASLGDVAVRDHRIFVGKLDTHTLGLGERLVAKVVRAPEGDFRDWDDIRGWGRGIAAALSNQRAGSTL
jgi:menaquinone-dependent protoporphyrinogen oxidase